MLKLNEVWTETIKMWENIIKDLPDFFYALPDAEKEYCIRLAKAAHYHGSSASKYQCHFCDHSQATHGCDQCPARLVNPEFSCQRADYHYMHEPYKFLKEIKRLHKIYLDKYPGT